MSMRRAVVMQGQPGQSKRKQSWRGSSSIEGADAISTLQQFPVHLFFLNLNFEGALVMVLMLQGGMLFNEPCDKGKAELHETLMQFCLLD